MERNVLDRRSVPFVMVTRQTIEDERLKAADKSMYATLCMYADNRSSDCFPSKETIMKKSGISDKTFRNALETLQDYGYIEVRERRDNNGKRLSNLYVLLDVGGR